MTKEELIEMIDTTINENGSRNITGKALNLALTEIVNAMGTGSGGASGAVLIFAEELTEEQKAVNATVYAQCKAAAEAGEPLPIISLDMSAQMASMGTNGVMWYLATATAFDASGGMFGSPALAIMSQDLGTIIVSEDGTITPMGGMSTMSLNR